MPADFAATLMMHPADGKGVVGLGLTMHPLHGQGACGCIKLCDTPSSRSRLFAILSSLVLSTGAGVGQLGHWFLGLQGRAACLGLRVRQGLQERRGPLESAAPPGRLGGMGRTGRQVRRGRRGGEVRAGKVQQGASRRRRRGGGGQGDRRVHCRWPWRRLGGRAEAGVRATQRRSDAPSSG
jgi:hypothetical protein